MYILHTALQGCLRGKNVEYGITADTGGHIRYLLELADCSASDEKIERVDIVTRGFVDEQLGAGYAQPVEVIDSKRRILRLLTDNEAYLPKEELWQDHEQLIERFLDLLEANGLPDLIHAHYADAAVLAAAAKARFGTPYIFTAHSLGRVKAEAQGHTPDLDRRIAVEEAALAGADAVIASSRDEAEKQLAAYDAYRPGCTRIIAPGGDFERFRNAHCSSGVRRELRRFLNDPDKPALLAIARPVTKKNLAALVHAYGQSPALQEAANLVLVAGTRTRLDRLETECAGNLSELFALIDEYDLYGKVAYPKQHCDAEIPEYYAFARDTGGIFINPALNEPFGLTLLEAAAAGLPVVATDSGGPNDIVETCKNGILIAPQKPQQIADACCELLGVPSFWRECSENGARALEIYDWRSYCRQYHAMIDGLVSAQQPAAESGHRHLLVSDIDNTLVGDNAALQTFCRWQAGNKDVSFGIATGRTFHSALSILSQLKVEPPAFVIGAVGTEIYHREANGVTYRRDAAWSDWIAHDWDRDAVCRVIDQSALFTRQDDLEQLPFKISYFAQGVADAAAQVRALLADAGLSATVIRSHDRYLDILPVRASKGEAVEHVRKGLGIAKADVIAAGDSANDVEMLRTAARPIIVANYCDGLADRDDLSHAYVARASHAAGVLEGVDYHLRRSRSAA
ncbi:MAG: HAD-IIB family hydrolase [Pacificimonas sp.]|jgi:sucrose-phosphate synthase|nr:HAD-IIB family hydrolase [Pacificimonas sp.]